MVRQPLRNHCFALLDFLFRRPIRGCRTVWAALWRLFKISFASHLPHLGLRYSLASIPPPSLYCRATSCCRGSSPSNTYDCSPCSGLVQVDPTGGILSVQNTKVVTGAVLPYSTVCAGGYSLRAGTSLVKAIGPSESIVGNVNPITAETQPIAMSPVGFLHSTSSVSSPGRNEDKHLYPSNSSQILTSSETLNIPLQHILVRPPSSNVSFHPDNGQFTPIRYSMGVNIQFGTETCSSCTEISNDIYPMLPTAIPRYEYSNSRIM